MLPSTDIKWAAFEPDKSPYSSGFSDGILNVHPTADGYKSLRSWAGVGTALAAACKGATTVRKAAGTTDIYALSATKAYKLDASDITWDDVTRLVGGDYGADVYWSFAQYGSYLVATNGVDANQYIDVDVGTNFAALSNAPKARYVAVMGDHLLFGALDSDKRAVAWSGVNDATYWTYGYRGSDSQSFPDGGDVQNVLGIGKNALVLQDDKIRIIEYVGGSLTFQTRVLHETLGCFAPFSAIAVRNIPFWYAESGFFMGLDAKPIGAERINRYVEQNSNPANRALIYGAADPSENIVWWLIPKVDGTKFMVGYDWMLDKWTQSDTNLDVIFPAISPGYTIDSLGTLGYTMDTIPYPFDSPFWQGDGLQQLAGFSSAGSFGYFSGVNQAATLETNDIEFNPGGYAYSQSARMISDAPYSLVSIQAASRAFHGQDLVWGNADPVQSSTGVSWIRKRGKTHRFRATISSGDWYNANGLTVYYKPAGGR